MNGLWLIRPTTQDAIDNFSNPAILPRPIIQTTLKHPQDNIVVPHNKPLHFRLLLRVQA